MTVAVRTRVSEEEYLATMTGEKPALEFVNGELFQKPMTKSDHNNVGRVLGRAFFGYEDRAGGYFAWTTTTNLSDGSDRRYRVPDVAFYTAGRPIDQPNGVYFPPTLAVEIRSQAHVLNSATSAANTSRAASRSRGSSTPSGAPSRSSVRSATANRWRRMGRSNRRYCRAFRSP